MFQKYNYVYEVYKQKSFTKAAEKLFISQPSLSVAIKNIEKQIGSPLFVRSNSEIRLTEVGEIYIDSVKKIIAIENEFDTKLSDINDLSTGHISVGGSNFVCSYILPRIINRFNELHSNIEISLFEENSTNLKDMDIDILVDNLDSGVSDFKYFSLLSENILLCVSKYNPINEKLKEFRILPLDIKNKKIDISKMPAVPFSFFSDEKFILLKKGNDMYNHALAAFESSGIFPQVSFSVDQLNTSFALTESNLGISFMTDTLIKYTNRLPDVVLYKFDNSMKNRKLYIAYRENKYCTKAMTEFIKITREMIKDS